MGTVCVVAVLADSGSAETLEGAGRFRLTGTFELWRFFNISGNVLNKHWNVWSVWDPLYVDQ